MNHLNIPNNVSGWLKQTEIDHLNRIGSKINSYVALILSANAELSDFQKLSLAIELYKVDVLKEINITGRVSIDDSVTVRGLIETMET